MALSDKNIIITPNIGQTADPKIEFRGASSTLGPQTITLNVYPTSNGTISLEGSAGQLFSVTNTLTGTIYSVNDVSGIPSIEVLDTGLVKLAQYGGNVVIGTGTDSGNGKVQLQGSFRAGSGWNISPASTLFSHTLSAVSGAGNRVINFDGNGNLPSVWWTNGSRAYGAIDAQDPGLTFWANNGSAWQKQISLGYGTVNIDTILQQAGNQVLHAGNYTSYSPSLTGGSASGTWGINITGNAATITSQANSATINASTGVNVNDIVRRDGSGYIYASHINFSTGIENPSISSFITDNGDGWTRKSSLDHVKNSIRGIADGTWDINITGNSATTSNASNSWQLGTDTGSKSNALQYWQLSGDAALNPSADWHYAIRMSHGDAATYYSATLALNFFSDTLSFRRKQGGANQSWRTVLHNANYTSYVGDGTITVVAGAALTGGGSFTVNQMGVTTVTLAHADTSSQASLDNSGGTVIQDVTVDTYGHVTGLGTVDLDSRYYTESEINQFRWYHSDRDFPNGTLIQTSINYSQTEGDPWVLEIRGNSYGNTIPFDIQYQGYIYSNTVINHGGYSNGTNITGLVLFNYNGNLCFWFPYQSYWQGFNVYCYTAYATYAQNKVTSITNVAKPASVTKEVALSANIRQSLHSGNYNSYSPTLTGTGASGSWGISITGNAATATSATTAGSVTNSITFNTSGGAAAGTTYNGSAARTIDYSTIGAAASSHTHSYLPLSGGTMTGIITTVSSGTAINFSGQSDSFGYNATAGLGTYIKGTGSTYIYGGGSFYDGSAYRAIVHAGNYNSYSPTLTGSGASGTWSINIAPSKLPYMSGFRNRLINPRMEINQRGLTGLTAINPAYYTTDRWKLYGSGQGIQWAVSTDVPSGTGFKNSFKLGKTSGNIYNGIRYIYQVIEYPNMADLAGQTVTLSWWGKTGTTISATPYATIYTGTVADEGSAGVMAGTWTGQAQPLNYFWGSSTWTRYSTTATISSSAKELAVAFYITPTGTAGADDFFYITGIQLELGSFDTNTSTFEWRDNIKETLLSQRYYYEQMIDIQAAVTNYYYLTRFNYPVAMRIAPTITNKTAGTLSNISITTEAANITTQGFYIQTLSTGTNGYVTVRVNAVNAEL